MAVSKFVLGPDGIQRKDEDEAKLDGLAHAAFTTPSGREILQYLRDITINTVGGPGISDAELRHREGSRFIVGVIEQRMKNYGKRQSARSE